MHFGIFSNGIFNTNDLMNDVQPDVVEVNQGTSMESDLDDFIALESDVDEYITMGSDEDTLTLSNTDSDLDSIVVNSKSGFTPRMMRDY